MACRKRSPQDVNANHRNGITRLDLERLKQIANVYDIPVEDLINTDDSIYISEIKDNKVGFNNSHVTIQDKSENETKLYEKLLEEKDRMIDMQFKLIAELEEKLKNK